MSDALQGRFDYSSPAEVYYGRSPSRRAAVKYRRFTSAAEAIRFIVEELPADLRNATSLEVDGERIVSAAIQGLYDDTDYPLKRP